jgi:hypothetical protein
MNENTITRRSLLGKTAAGAAAAAVVAAIPTIADAAPELKIPAAAQRPGLSTWRDPAIMAREHELERQFEATLTPSQDDLWMQLSDTRSDQILAEQEKFVAALGEHMPGLARAIEIVAFGHGDIASGRCCDVWYI